MRNFLSINFINSTTNSGYTTTANIKSGQAFYRAPTSSLWTDAGAVTNGTCFRNKAHTMTSSEVFIPEITLADVSVTVGCTASLSTSMNAGENIDLFTYSSSDPSTVTASSDGVATGIKAGTANILTEEQFIEKDDRKIQ